MDNCYLGWFWNFETKEFERWREKKNFDTFLTNADD